MKASPNTAPPRTRPSGCSTFHPGVFEQAGLRLNRTHRASAVPPGPSRYVVCGERTVRFGTRRTAEFRRFRGGAAAARVPAYTTTPQEIPRIASSMTGDSGRHSAMPCAKAVGTSRGNHRTFESRRARRSADFSGRGRWRRSPRRNRDLRTPRAARRQGRPLHDSDRHDLAGDPVTTARQSLAHPAATFTATPSCRPPWPKRLQLVQGSHSIGFSCVIALESRQRSMAGNLEQLRIAAPTQGPFRSQPSGAP